MMKKLLVLMLVFGMASAAWAFPYLVVNVPKDDYHPSDTIQINLVSPTADGAVIGITIDAITDNPGGACKGTTSGPETFNSQFNVTYPGSLNDDGMLVEYMGASDTTNTGTTGTLFSFLYHVPSVQASTYLDIQTWDDGGDNYLQAAVVYKVGGEMDGTIGMQTPIHVVPEPTTIALLGLGGLFLRRRKKQQTA